MKATPRPTVVRDSTAQETSLPKRDLINTPLISEDMIAYATTPRITSTVPNIPERIPLLLLLFK